jgi:hypothetical protein
LIPPALITVSLGVISTKLEMEGDGKIMPINKMNLTIAGAASVFDDDTLADFITDLSKLIEHPLSISL